MTTHESQRKSESLTYIYDHLLTNITNNRLLPSGDSSCTYVPVKYRWTNADFPLDRFPTMPCKGEEQNIVNFLAHRKEACCFSAIVIASSSSVHNVHVMVLWWCAIQSECNNYLLLFFYSHVTPGDLSFLHFIIVKKLIDWWLLDVKCFWKQAYSRPLRAILMAIQQQCHRWCENKTEISFIQGTAIKSEFHVTPRKGFHNSPHSSMSIKTK